MNRAVKVWFEVTFRCTNKRVWWHVASSILIYNYPNKVLKHSSHQAWQLQNPITAWRLASGCEVLPKHIDDVIASISSRFAMGCSCSDVTKLMTCRLVYRYGGLFRITVIGTKWFWVWSNVDKYSVFTYLLRTFICRTILYFLRSLKSSTAYFSIFY